MPHKQITYKLVLHPLNTGHSPINWEDIKPRLLQAGFIGKPSQLLTESYLVGENFLQLITFLGCSPYIQLEPNGNNDNLCHIVFGQITEKLQFRHLTRDAIARCPKCKNKLSHWQDHITQWEKSAVIDKVTCEHCVSCLSLFELNWRHNAAFAHCFIDIYNVHPQEAIPTEELLAILDHHTGQKWDYFFSD